MKTAVMTILLLLAVCAVIYKLVISLIGPKCFAIVVSYPEPLHKDNSTLLRKKTIVWLDVMHNVHGLRLSYQSAMFDKCRGIARNCEILPHVITNPRLPLGNKTFGPLNADAVLVMGCHLSRMMVPIRRDTQQVFVFVERENWLAYTAFDKIEYSENRLMLRDQMLHFNWTMSYRLDSDIPFPYGHVIRKPHFEETLSDSHYEKIYKSKIHSVVWLVSHCSVPSQRSHFVDEMKSYIDIRIYGRCGDLVCRNRSCVETIIKEHKFVLSFENTYYNNYVTEKLFSWFDKDIIQVVRGGGVDYSFYGIPEKTVIDADDFENPETLARFLNALGNDKSAYIDYLKRKSRHVTIPPAILKESAYCNLCAKLNDVNIQRKSYTHIGAWYASDLYQTQYCPWKEWEHTETESLKPIVIKNKYKKEKYDRIHQEREMNS